MAPTFGERTMQRMCNQHADLTMDNKIQMKSRESNIHKGLSEPLRIFFILNQVFASLDLGFQEYKTSKIRFLLKLGTFAVSLIQGIIVIAYLYTKMNDYYQAWGTKLLLEYYLYVLILICTPDDRTFCSYLTELQFFDEQIGVQSSSYKLGLKILVYWSLSALSDVICMYISYLAADNYVGLLTLDGMFYIVKRTCSLPLILLFFVFYSMLCRLEKLKFYINDKKLPVHRALELYGFLIDSIEKVIRSFKYIYIVYLLSNVPGVIESFFSLIKLIKSDEGINYLKIIAPYFNTVIVIIIMIIPPIVATMLSQEAFNIKLILHNRVLEEVDENEIEVLEKFINYVEARPFKFYMLYLIPMDATLMIILFNFSINYLIVLIQITHVL